MKGKTQIFAVISVLYILLFTSQNAAAFQKAEGIDDQFRRSASSKIFTELDLQKERVLIAGIWWIFVYDNGKLIEVFPE